MDSHTEILDSQSKILDNHTKILDNHTKLLDEHTEKIDALTAELHEVHKLADATLDIVKGRYEKNKREIDEIEDYLNLPKEPYFAIGLYLLLN